MVLGSVEGRPATIACDRAAPAPTPVYFVLMRFVDGAVAEIRDYRYARHVMESALVWVANGR